MRSRCFVLLCTSTVAFIYTVNYLLQYEIHIRIWNHDNAIGAEGSYLLRPRIHFLVDTPTCSIPNMDGLSADLGRFISPMPPLACAPDAPLVVSNTTALHVRDLRHTCCYQELFREGDDTYWYDNRCTPIPPGGATVVNGSSSVEFVRVQCTVPGESSKEQSDFHAFVPAKAAVEQRCREPAIADGVSVLLLGMDSVSRLNFHRQMPLTVARLRDMGAIEMMGYNKVGDNTFPNMVGIFSGLNEQELKYECWDNDNMPFDKCPWIWKNFSDAGYRTMFIEDIPYIGMFNFKKKGFQKQPTDYYTRPFMTALDEEIGHKGTETSNRCAGSRLQIQIVLDYVQKFVTTFAESLYWGFAWSTSLSHDELNAPQLADPLFSAALKRMSDQQLMNNTVLILLSDHGMRTGSFRETYQGRLEERLPFLFFVFPDWFRRRYASAVATLQGNAHRLTSPFDLHATLADLLHLPALETAAREESPDARGVSLFSAAPENRTCEQAGIAQHWCTCHSTTTLSADSEMALRAADALVAFINGLLQPFKSKCARLWLSQLVSARASVQPIVTLYGEYDAGVTNYLVTVETTPGGGLFESTLQYRENCSRFFVERDAISRINLYGNQSACIDDFHMKLFCYCFELFS